MIRPDVGSFQGASSHERGIPLQDITPLLSPPYATFSMNPVQDPLVRSSDPPADYVFMGEVRLSMPGAPTVWCQLSAGHVEGTILFGAEALRRKCG